MAKVLRWSWIGLIVAGAISGCNSPNPPTTSGNLPPQGSVTLSWAPVTGETGYKIEQSSDGTVFKQVQAVGSAVTSSTVTGLNAGVTYYFRVRASDLWGDSGPSSVVQVTAG